MFLVAIIPPIILLKVVYSIDSQKEPLKLILAMFAVGILSGSVTILGSYVIQYYFPQLEQLQNNGNMYSMFLYVFLTIGILEEFCKWFFSYNICWKNRDFDQKYDAIVYMVAVSLGFSLFDFSLDFLPNKSA